MARTHYLGGVSIVLNKQQTIQCPTGNLEVRCPKDINNWCPRSATQTKAMEWENVDFRKMTWHYKKGSDHTNYPTTGLRIHNPGKSQKYLGRECNFVSRGHTNIFGVPKLWLMHKIYFFIFLKSQIEPLLFFSLIKSCTKLPFQLWKSKKKEKKIKIEQFCMIRIFKKLSITGLYCQVQAKLTLTWYWIPLQETLWCVAQWYQSLQEFSDQDTLHLCNTCLYSKELEKFIHNTL